MFGMNHISDTLDRRLKKLKNTKYMKYINFMKTNKIIMIRTLANREQMAMESDEERWRAIEQ